MINMKIFGGRHQLWLEGSGEGHHVETGRQKLQGWHAERDRNKSRMRGKKEVIMEKGNKEES